MLSYIYLHIKNVNIYMIDQIESLDKKLIIKSVKTILSILPIIIISNNSYIKHYGDYSFTFDISQMVNIFLTDTNRCLFPFFVFSGLLLGSYIFEKNISPFIAEMLGCFGDTFKNALIKYDVDKILNKMLGINPLLYAKYDSFPKYEVIGHMMYLPVTLILWCICLDSIYSIVLIFLISFVTFFMLKVVNTVYKINSIYNELNRDKQ